MYYFASDIHLGSGAAEQSRCRERLFTAWLEQVSSDAKEIFLVGDIFDFWYEYKRVVPKGFTRLFGTFSALTDKGVRIHFFTGNHDMWIGDYLHEECGLILHTSSAEVELYGKRCYIAHGDNLLIDHPLMLEAMNRMFRCRPARWIFTRAVHPDLALRFGQWWSGRSRKLKTVSHSFAGEDETLVRWARRALEAAPGVDYFVFGHNHCAELYPLDGRSTAVFLGEWLENPTYASLAPDGAMKLRRYGSEFIR